VGNEPFHAGHVVSSCIKASRDGADVNIRSLMKYQFFYIFKTESLKINKILQ